jgi:hypothetical protein
MGFDTETFSQDNSTFGVFGIKTELPIPLIYYGDCYTWAKYARQIVPPDLQRTVWSGTDKTYRKTLYQFKNGFCHILFESTKNAISNKFPIIMIHLHS